MLADLHVNLSSSDSRVTASVLDTVGVIYEEYDAYRSRFPETDEAYRRRRERLLGLLMRGLSGIDGATRQEALYVLGRRVFGSGELGRHEKRRAFMLTERKLLSAQSEFPGEGLTFYYRAAMLGRLYRFLTEERLFHRGFDFGEPRPVAFFPGTFDPFTLSHKGIVKAIRDLGYEVLLAIDEFSWSKKTQPYRLRRRIAAMSVADVFHVSIFPEDFPVNIANPHDLRALRQAFPGRSVSIVVGSDVVLHASSYKKPVTPRFHPHLRPCGVPPHGAGRGAGGLQLHHRKGGGADAAAPAGGDQLHPHPRGGGRQPGHLQPHRPGGAGVHLPPGLYLREPQDSPCCARRISASCLPRRRQRKNSCAPCSPSPPPPPCALSWSGTATRSWSAGTRTAPFSARRPMSAWTPPTCSPVWATRRCRVLCGRTPAAAPCSSAACSSPGASARATCASCSSPRC